jgi:hypothetical protein
MRDFSGYLTLSVEMKADPGTSVIDIGIKTNTQPDDGSETKVPVKLVPEWKTYELSLSRFEGTDLKTLYVVAEFIFANDKAQTIYVRNVKYLARPPATWPPARKNGPDAGAVEFLVGKTARTVQIARLAVGLDWLKNRRVAGSTLARCRFAGWTPSCVPHAVRGTFRRTQDPF